MGIGDFGPRILGEKQFREEQKKAETSADIFGERLLGPKITEQPDPIPAETEDAPPPAEDPETEMRLADADLDNDGNIEVKEIEQILAERPELLDRFIEAEGHRTPMRKTAFRAFLKVEQAKDEPRPDVVKALKARS